MIVLSDNDVRGAVNALSRACFSADFLEITTGLEVEFLQLEDVGLHKGSDDVDIWHLCQAKQMLLVTGDRTEKDAECSFEHIIREFGKPDSLPIFTFGDAVRVFHERKYAWDCASRLLGYIIDIERLRGAGRIYLSP